MCNQKRDQKNHFIGIGVGTTKVALDRLCHASELAVQCRTSDVNPASVIFARIEDEGLRLKVLKNTDLRPLGKIVARRN